MNKFKKYNQIALNPNISELIRKIMTVTVTTRLSGKQTTILRLELHNGKFVIGKMEVNGAHQKCERDSRNEFDSSDLWICFKFILN